VIYCRVSSERQEQDGVSLDAQEQAARRLCQERGLKVVQVVREVASAMDMRRQHKLRALLPTGDAARADHLVVLAVSRLTRSVAGGLQFVQRLRHYEVQLLSVEEQVDITTASGEYNLTNLLNHAEYEGRLISQRVSAALRLLRERGVEFGPPPFGKQAVRDDQNIRRFQDEPAETPVLRFVQLARTAGASLAGLNGQLAQAVGDAFDTPIELDDGADALTQPLSWKNIAALLNAYGIRKRDRDWTAERARSVLLSRRAHRPAQMEIEADIGSMS
ncbi:Resolvase, partial [uncultured virus]